MKKIIKTENTPDDATVWFRPQYATPENGEIVVIACEVEITGPAGVQLVRKLQTAIYEQRGVEGEGDGVQELWHCGEAFKTLIYWLRLPPVPEETIILPKKPGIIL